MTPAEERAARAAEKLVTVEDNATSAFIHIVGHYIEQWASIDRAKEHAARVRSALAPALLDFAADAVHQALADAMALGEEKERPVSESEEEQIRKWAADLTNASHHHDLLALLDREREQTRRLEARLLLCVTDGGAWADGYNMGRQYGREEGRTEQNEADARAAFVKLSLLRLGGVADAVVKAIKAARLAEDG